MPRNFSLAGNAQYWYSNSIMTPSLTPHELSELSGLLLQEVGKLTLLHEQHALTQYGYGRMDTLTALYHKLNTMAAEPEVQAPIPEVFRGRMMNAPVPDVPSRAVLRAKLDDAAQTRDLRLNLSVNADFVYDLLYLGEGSEFSRRANATEYLSQYTGITTQTAFDIINEVTR